MCDLFLAKVRRCAVEARDVHARLGDSVDEFVRRVGQEGLVDLAAAIEIINRRYAGPELDQDREAAIAAVTACGLGYETLASLTEAWREAKARERAAMAALTGGVAWASAHDRRPNIEIARMSGLARETVRKAPGRRG